MDLRERRVPRDGSNLCWLTDEVTTGRGPGSCLRHPPGPAGSSQSWNPICTGAGRADVLRNRNEDSHLSSPSARRSFSFFSDPFMLSLLLSPQTTGRK